MKVIDRLQYTKRLFKNQNVVDYKKSQDFVVTCPSCGGHKLIHEAGCMHCIECGYDRCGI